MYMQKKNLLLKEKDAQEQELDVPNVQSYLQKSSLRLGKFNVIGAKQ